MRTFSLQSGSNGNAIYVEAGDVRLLFDAGISGKLAEGRMRVHGRDIRDVTAVIISHDHVDHIRCAGVFHRRFKLPVYMTGRTHAAIRCNLGTFSDLRHFQAGDRLEFGSVTVHTIPTPHDAADGVAFVVEHERRRLGVMTDLGHPFDALCRALPELDAVYLESNYDAEMLASGPYPAYLQARIRGNGGHLSNDECAALVRRCCQRWKWAALAHLSHDNNRPDLALDTHRRQVGATLPLHVASRYDVGDMLEV